ncbi:MAG TPA: hypothetical protein VIJ82_23520 [Streptosporangiaceae bacterium]|jgi:hypothetical protein
MGSNHEEPNRVLGIPRGPGPGAPRRRQGKEQQYIAGLPAEMFEQVDTEWLRSLVHPVRGYRRWARRRRLGIYDTDEDEPQAKR